ncbi:hypothetical protein B4064_2552 [Caldibacillus thermoamylovorans]|jgi:hypothetical protein|uniref:Uncharacterized protein n=1 Tax=Caldibacillus thermoamylovorans TaxID=35841 RepID=A0A0D0G5L4_9BACI|nr:hypothetical protein B4065_3481 [Caldibacillus thermoamylovorans]KIO65681.1 hypothetical protein B4064_2552 [Caldibacillus thermoamylovorans]KIO66082.1 hypothetical protein B4166_1095 [Caldibacillus thermoamylovorans]KIO72507.1 hypothetical protein B4167_1197 [Caldibacillus thermoamylovorans]
MLIYIKLGGTAGDNPLVPNQFWDGGIFICECFEKKAIGQNGG